MDITEINDNINDKNCHYNYILSVIDHHSKLCGSYLLETKNAEEIYKNLCEFISHYGPPKLLQCDNGKEFSNSLINQFCNDLNIKLIHSKPRHPQTNGAIERLHREIKKGLLIEKLSKKDKYNIKIAIINVVFSHNNTINRTTKYKPIDLFYNKNDRIQNEAIDNTIKSQKNINKNLKVLAINSFVLISDYYTKSGNLLNVKFNKKGKKLIPGIIVGKGSGTTYPIKISIDDKDLEKDKIFDVDYRLIKTINENVYNLIMNNKIYLDNEKICNLYSDDEGSEEN